MKAAAALGENSKDYVHGVNCIAVVVVGLSLRWLKVVRE